MLKKFKNVLIIAPHADDEILGCGGIIAKYKKTNFTILICTNANNGAPELFSKSYIDKVRKEAKSSHKFLGIKKTIYLNLPAPRLDQYPIYKISNMINEIIKKKNYDTVFFPNISDLHIDHKIIAHSTIVATRPMNNQMKLNLISYETLSETEWGSIESENTFSPNFYISLSKLDLERKIKSFNFFQSQKINFNHPRSAKGIKSLAEYRGKFISENYAEAFKIVRLID